MSAGALLAARGLAGDVGRIAPVVVSIGLFTAIALAARALIALTLGARSGAATRSAYLARGVRYGLLGAIFVLLGQQHSATALDPSYVPFPIAARFRHVPYERVRGALFFVEGWSFWRSPNEVVGYSFAKVAIVSDHKALLALFPPGSPHDAARRIGMIRHGCDVLLANEPLCPGSAGPRSEAKSGRHH